MGRFCKVEHRSSSSWSNSRSLTEKAGGGIRSKSMLVEAGCRGFLGQWLVNVNVGAINSSSSGSIQAGANGGTVVVEAETVEMG